MQHQTNLGKPRVLIIDGRPEEMRDFVQISCQHWQLAIATKGCHGIQRALGSPFDIVLLDTNLPDMDGFSACRFLMESPSTAHVPVIFHTSANSIDDRLKGFSCGGVDYLIKPCSPQEIVARIRVHLRHLHRPPANENTSVARPHYEQIVFQVATQFIRQSLNGHYSLDEIAKQSGVHKKKLSSIFSRYAGMTVFAWIREERFRRGEELLTSTSMSIQDIANEVGFYNACNFTTAFRLRTGQTPNQFRKAALAWSSTLANGVTGEWVNKRPIRANSLEADQSKNVFRYNNQKVTI
jgi:DNA-binding response OmpR family regulator